MLSENGDKLLISKTYYDQSIYVGEQLNNATRAVSLKDTVYTLSNDKGYSKDIGPMSTTNKSLLDVLSLVGLGSGMSKIRAIHPIFGVISFVATGISAIGIFYKTFYIRFWRAYQLNIVGGLTRNKERWFSEIGCSNDSFVNNNTSYFNSSRPGY